MVLLARNETMVLSLARTVLLVLLLGHVCAAAAANTTASGIRALFLFKDVLKSDTTAITTSGFNTVVIFGVGLLENGDVMYYSNTPGSKDTLVASNGSYVGGDALADKVRSFKKAAGGDKNTTTTTTTGISRVEISMNAQHVRDLMRTPGPDASSPLYRNLVALRTAWDLDAVNNDDESAYDAISTVEFARMLGAIGYKYTVAPYTDARFWAAVKTEINTGVDEKSTDSGDDGGDNDPLLDRVYLQCYDGGASNDPASWQRTLGMKVVPLVWVVNDSKPSYGTTAAQAKTRFSQWNTNSPLAGGGYWNDFDIEKMNLSYTDYGDVLKSIFP